MSECVVRISFPTACGPCEMCGTGACKAWMKVDWKELGHTKPEDCPIICSLPEGHGRLVDMRDIDLMMENASSTSDESGLYSLVYRDDLDFDGLTTIVPAEAERSET